MNIIEQRYPRHDTRYTMFWEDFEEDVKKFGLETVIAYEIEKIEWEKYELQ